MPKLTQKMLKEVLNYNPDTGIFNWIVRRMGTKIGGIAGCIGSPKGYRQIMIDGCFYKESRLAFLYMDGYFPEHEVDHIDRVKDNNKWKNLRHVTRQCNARNMGLQKNNTSGVTGVCFEKKPKKWGAKIKVDGKNIHLGYFDKKEDAVRARWNAEIRYDFPNCQTSSTSYLYLKDHGIIQGEQGADIGI